MKLRHLCALVAAAVGSPAFAQSVSATLTANGANYSGAGGSVTLTAAVSHPGQTLTTLGWAMQLPTGWSYAGVAGGAAIPSVAPQAGDTVELSWAYIDPSTLPEPAQFTATLNYPAGLSGAQTITATVNYKVSGNSALQAITVTPVVLAAPPGAPTIAAQPQAQSTGLGGSVLLNVVADGTGPFTYQWKKDGQDIAAASAASFGIGSLQPGDAGAYTVVVSNSAGSVASQPAAVGAVSTAKVEGTAIEFQANIVHVNTNVYDQLLLTGAAATATADPGQITRMSFIDLDDDIVQVEFSGAGTLALTLEDAVLTPTPPAKYNQPTVNYVKGRASIVMTGVDQSTNLTIFTVGTQTALNGALFKPGEDYDAIADLGLLSITSADGTMAAIRAGNVHFSRSRGATGLNAPGVAVQRVVIGDIQAEGEAVPVLRLGAATDLLITGGALLQANNRAVELDNLVVPTFQAGQRSSGLPLPAQSNRARFERDGVDVTSSVVP